MSDAPGFASRLFAALPLHGETPAVSSERERLSHAELAAQSMAMAARIARELDARVAPRIGIALQDGIEALIATLAVWRLGGTAAIVDFRSPRPQRARLARDFDLALMLESRSPPGEGRYPGVIVERGWRFGPTQPPQAALGEAPAFLMFSSGTTGEPKAYLQSQSTLLARSLGRVHGAEGGAPPRYLTGMTLAYSATRHHVFAHLLAGGEVRFFPPLFSPSEMIEGLLAFGATGTGQPPPVIARMLREAGERETPLFPALRSLDSIGGPARPEDKVAAWRYLSPGYRISYASSLTGAISGLAGADVPLRPESAGRVNKGVRVEILGLDGAPLPLGAPGLIRAHTPGVAAAMLLPGGRLHADPAVMGPGWGIPGDIGVLDGEGFLTLLDRAEDMIVRGGVTIAPQELELLIARMPGVADVAVAGFEDAVMGQEIAAFIVPGTPAPELEAVRRFLAAELSPERRPREIRFLPGLPYSDHGKLLRRVLVARLVAGEI